MKSVAEGGDSWVMPQAYFGGCGTRGSKAAEQAEGIPGDMCRKRMLPAHQLLAWLERIAAIHYCRHDVKGVESNEEAEAACPGLFGSLG